MYLICNSPSNKTISLLCNDKLHIDISVLTGHYHAMCSNLRKESKNANLKHYRS